MQGATKPLKRLALRTPKQPVRTNGHGKPIVALDIDGTLGDYHSHFLRFAELWFDRPMPPATEINPGLPLWKFMRVTRARYREAKLAYRQGGWKRWMPVYPGASELTRNIQKADAEVWICTTRPYLRLDSIDPDTREWLRRNRIVYNAVLFGDDKYSELKRQAGERVCAVADDLPDLLHKSLMVEIPGMLYLRSQPYNQGDFPNFMRVGDLFSLWLYISHDIQRWKEANG